MASERAEVLEQPGPAGVQDGEGAPDERGGRTHAAAAGSGGGADSGAARIDAAGEGGAGGEGPGLPAGDAPDDEGAQGEELDPEVRARRDAALRHVRQLGDPVLRARAVPVERFDERLRAEIERMGTLMQDALGVGLAATQVGVMHRLFVYRADPEGPVRALVNPVI
ncbi:MAG: peptide deformylase, partial [Acidobacteriota bacterium]|nr:peptide deformylase [Acidobacteriota bacterium]